MFTLQDLFKNNELIKYKIRANTDNFTRTDEPISVLSGATKNRMVSIDKELFKGISKQEQINIAKKEMKKHFDKFSGKLPVFGKITSYSFYLDEEIVIDIKNLDR